MLYSIAETSLCHAVLPPQNMEESQDLAAAITRRLRALQTYSLPQLAGCHSDTALYDELAGDISQNTQIIEGELEVS